jgi:hypothetical protein
MPCLGRCPWRQHSTSSQPEVVFDLAAERPLAGRFIDLVAALELPVALGCARLLAVDGVFDPLRDRVGAFPGALRPVRDCFF